MGVPDPHRDPQFYDGVPARRLVAFGIDFIVILFLMFCVAVVGAILTLGSMFLAGPLVMLTFSVTGFVYRWIMVWKRSATLGMILTGIEVRDGQGDRMTQLTAFIHTAGLYATFFFVST